MDLLCTTAQLELHKCSSTLTRELETEGSWRSYISRTFSQSSTKIPDPAVFQEFDKKSVKKSSNSLPPLPTIAQCAAHLELLQVINHFRRAVLNSTQLDEVLGIRPQKRTEIRNRGTKFEKTIELKDMTFEKRRGEKWSIYLNIAVAAFLHWLKAMDDHPDLGTANFKSGTLELPACPPLHILIAWHTALLNPQWFRQHCEKNGITRMRRVLFPWPKIHQAINPENWAFSPPDAEPDLLGYILGPKSESFAKLYQMYGNKASERAKYSKVIRDLCNGSLEYPEKTIIEAFLDTSHEDPARTYLVSAIQRQQIFIDKMVRYLWICSPAVHGTLSRAIDRYDHFVQLFKLYSDTLLVPTLDIDLVWHTHQCSASAYEEAMNVRAGQFINHDDTIKSTVLETQSDRTGVLFREHFGIEYIVCLCWECEALQSVVDALEDEDIGAADFNALTESVLRSLVHCRDVEINRRKGMST